MTLTFIRILLRPYLDSELLPPPPQSKTLRERWLLEGTPSSASEGDEDMKKQMQEDEQKTRVLEESIARWAAREGVLSGDTGRAQVDGPGDTSGDPHQGWAGVTVDGGQTLPGLPPVSHPDTWSSRVRPGNAGVPEEGRSRHQPP